MLTSLAALCAQPVLLVLVLGVGAAIGIGVDRLVDVRRRAEKRAARRGRSEFDRLVGRDNRQAHIVAAQDKLGQAADQLKIVMGAEFRRLPLLNRPEARLFKALDALVVARNPSWQVMAQVSVGEFVGSDDRAAFGCINSKRVDLLLMDEDCHARHALEYQGTGHHQGAAAARDAVKKEALRKAGIGYHEIVAGHTTPDELRQLIERLVPARTADAA